MTPDSLPSRYRILRVLGRGGQGTVYAAADSFRGDEPVALKVMDLGRSGLEDAVRARSEFLILASIVHPHVARVRDFGYLADGVQAYFTSDLILGGHLLDAVLAVRAHDRWTFLLEMATQALGALRHLALRGLHHADLKPTNLLVVRPEDPALRCLKIVDFGSASLEGRGHVASGTPAYLPPPGALEGEFDGQARDLVALGLSLHHAAVGRLPFDPGDPAASSAWWRSADAAHPRAFDPAVSEGLDELIAGLTARAAHRRLRDAGEALEFLRHRVSPRPRTRSGYPGEPWSKRRESQIEDLALRLRRIRHGIWGITAPPLGGKSRFLEVLRAHLQVDGVACITFGGADDSDAMHRVEALAESSLAVPATKLEIPDLASRVEEWGRKSAGVALILDLPANPASVERSGRPAEFVRAWARLADSSERTGAVLIAASTTLEKLSSALMLAVERIHALPLNPFDTGEVTEAAREFLGAEAPPEILVRELVRASGGLPGRLAEALRSLPERGVGIDALGQVVLPQDGGPLVTTRRTEMPPLEPRTRRVLWLLEIAAEPQEPWEAHARFSEFSTETWRTELEALHAEGLATRRPGTEDFEYAPVADHTEPAVPGLSPTEVRRARERVLVYLEEQARRAPRLATESLVAAATNALALGRESLLLKWVLPALRRLSWEGRDWDAVDLLSKHRFSPRADRKRGRPSATDLVLLDAGLAALRLARAEEALSFLTRRGEVGYPAYERALRRARSEALSLAGDTRAAAKELEPLLEGLEPPRDVLRSMRGLAGLEALVRLATLGFAAGSTAQARERLERARRLLLGGEARDEAAAREQGSRRPTTVEAGHLSRILGVLASAETAHGSPDAALAYLEWSLELARRLGRASLETGPLNELGILHARGGRIDRAIEAFDRMEEVARAEGSRMGSLRALYNKAVILYRTRNLERAEKFFREAGVLSQSMGHHALHGAVALGFAGVLQERGSAVEALRIYRRLLRRTEDLRASERVLAHGNLSELYLHLGRIRGSLLEAFRSCRASRALGDTYLRAFSLRLRGLARWAAGRGDKARADLDRARLLSESARDLRGEGIALHYAGLSCLGDGRPGEALRILRAGRRASRKAGDQDRVEAGLVSALEALLRLGRRKAGLRLARRLAEYARRPCRIAFRARVLLVRLGVEDVEKVDAWLRSALKGIGPSQRFDVFLALGEWLAGHATGDEERAALRLRRGLLVRGFTRGLSQRRSGCFLRAWSLISESGSEAKMAPSPTASPEGEGGSDLALWWEETRGLSRSQGIAGLLEGVRATFRLRSAILFFESNPGSPEVERALGSSTRPEDLLALHGATLDRVRVTGRIEERGRFVFLPLPAGGNARAVVVLEASGRRLPRQEGVLDRLRDKLALLSDEVDALAARRELEEALARSRESSEEVRRLGASLLGDRRELETALLTHGLGLLGLEREAGATTSKGGPPLRRPAAASSAMRAILSRIARIARADSPVLILGESGVGKDLIARVIHHAGPRTARPFLAEICNLAESIMEAELFGFVRGAFTGAVQAHRGIFERAAGGTIYLDEIADLTPVTQSRILRVLEEKYVRPLGAEEGLPVDFRLVSSSRRPRGVLEDPDVLRRDLYYRVNAEVIEIPPLRERREDIPEIVRQNVEEHSNRSGRAAPFVHPGALELLIEYPWPGNVRELENVLMRCLVGDPLEITKERVAEALHRNPAGHPRTGAPPEGTERAAPRSLATEPLRTLKEGKARLERELLERALTVMGGNATRAARALGITRRHLGSLLEKHGLRLEDWRGGSATDTAKPSGT